MYIHHLMLKPYLSEQMITDLTSQTELSMIPNRTLLEINSFHTATCPLFLNHEEESREYQKFTTLARYLEQRWDIGQL